MSKTADPLARLKDFDISEPYELVRTIEVVKGQCRYRLEVMKSLHSQNCYFVDCYRLVEQEETTTLEVMSAVWSRLSLEEFSGTEENDQNKALETALAALR